VAEGAMQGKIGFAHRALRGIIRSSAGIQFKTGAAPMIIRSLAVSAVIFLVFSASHAASDESLASAVLNCSTQPDETAQLACYNQIVARLKAGAAPVAQSSTDATHASPPQALAQAPAVPSGKQEKSSWYNVGGLFGGSNASPRASEVPQPTGEVVGTPADFGSENMPFRANAPVELDHITAGISNVSYDFFKHFTVTLNNGQVWRQVDEDANVARFKNGKKQVVTIKRGFLGNYQLIISGVWGTYAVKRIK
jgi:hypothetical protein